MIENTTAKTMRKRRTLWSGHENGREKWSFKITQIKEEI